MLRKPAVANQFYPGDPARLHYEVGRLMEDATKARDAIAVVAPHAGYMYSGHVAGAVFSRIRVPQKCIILGPNHTGFGAEVSVMAEGVWDMPLGEVPIATHLARRILELAPLGEADNEAHIYEHSLEVQVPFLQYRQKDLEIVPICLSRMTYEDCMALGRAISQAIREEGDGPEGVLVVASTDMTHYEPQEQASKKDALAIECIKALAPSDLYDTVIANRITMCGFIPTTVALVAALELGASRAELVKYATSGDITGDFRQVVGYAGFIIS